MKDRNPVGAAITGEMTVPAVSKSDEGLYMCVITDVGASAESWLAVRGEMNMWTYVGLILNFLHIIFFLPQFLRVFVMLQIQSFSFQFL